MSRDTLHTVTLHPNTRILWQVALDVVDGPDRGRRFLLDAYRSYTLGKGEANLLRLSDRTASRQHLEVTLDPEKGVVLARDLGSKNGSFYRGARFERMALTVDATMVIGSTVLRVVDPREEASAIEDDRFAGLDHFGGLLGHSVAIRSVYRLLGRIAPSDAPVLITGESGTGKEVTARAIHDHSSRRNQPFVVLDVTGLSAGVLDSELFGHVRGAFTGADQARVGIFEQAHGGTVFIDELGEMSAEMQPRLLRVLESGEIRPVGATQYRKVECRVVAATNRNLVEEVEEGRFRTDLYHRLAVTAVHLPALRDRKEDIPILAEAFLERLAQQGVPRKATTPAFIEALLAHHWPGNVRELRNILERAVVLSDGDELDARLLGIDPQAAARAEVTEHADVDADGSSPAAVDVDVPFHEAKTQLVDAWERDYLIELLERCKGNIALAARRAGVDRRHMHRLLKKHAR